MILLTIEIASLAAMWDYFWILQLLDQQRCEDRFAWQYVVILMVSK